MKNGSEYTNNEMLFTPAFNRTFPPIMGVISRKPLPSLGSQLPLPYFVFLLFSLFFSVLYTAGVIAK